MNYEIKPYEGVGAIKLNMSRDDVRKIINCQFKEFKKAPFSAVTTDDYYLLGIHVYYNKEDKCEAIELFNNSNPTFMGNSFFEEPVSNVVEWFKKNDDTIVIDDVSITSNRFGIGLYASAGIQAKDSTLDSIIVFAKGYYD